MVLLLLFLDAVEKNSIRAPKGLDRGFNHLRMTWLKTDVT